MNRLLISLFTVTLFVISCGKTTETNEEKSGVSEEAETQLTDDNPNEFVLTKYIAIKNALVKSDAELAAKEAELLARDNSSNPGISVSAENIASLTDIEMQRDEFFRLSAKVYELIKNSGELNQTVYWQYCPMAMDNQGANWLSLESEIRNPYFGDAMLTCGSVEEEL